MAWTDPRTWVVGEVVTAAIMNLHVRDQFLMIGPWAAGDMKNTYATHANAATTTLTEAQTGWYIANGATISSTTDPNLYAAIGNSTTLPDCRGRMLVAPGTHAEVDARGDSEGVAVGSRRPKHATSITTQPTISRTADVQMFDPGHYHTIPSNVGDGSGGLWRASEAAVQNTSAQLTGVYISQQPAFSASGGAYGPTSAAPTDMPAYLTIGMVLIKR